MLAKIRCLTQFIINPNICPKNCSKIIVKNVGNLAQRVFLEKNNFEPTCVIFLRIIDTFKITHLTSLLRSLF